MAIENKNRNAEEDASINVAEESRETSWKSKSYMASIFLGDFDISIPDRRGKGYPEQAAADKEVGDEILARIKEWADSNLDGDEIDVISTNTTDVQTFTVNDNSNVGNFDSSIGIDSEIVSGTYPMGSYIALNPVFQAAALSWTRIKTMRFKLFDATESIASMSNSAISKNIWWATRPNTDEYKNCHFLQIRGYIYEKGTNGSLWSGNVKLMKNPLITNLLVRQRTG